MRIGSSIVFSRADYRAFSLGKKNEMVAWLEEIMVLEEYRINGIGRRLMEEFEKWSISRGSKLIGLATRRAASFYKALEYEESAVVFRKLIGGND